MISLSCNIKEFIESVQHKGYWDLMTLLNQEATAAERMLYSSKTILAESYEKSKIYANTLKELITFLRYGVMSSKLSAEDVQSFTLICQCLIERKESGLPLRLCPQGD